MGPPATGVTPDLTCCRDRVVIADKATMRRTLKLQNQKAHAVLEELRPMYQGFISRCHVALW